jgi:hypothetical protein
VKWYLISFIIVSLTSSQCFDGKRLLEMFSHHPEAHYFFLKNSQRILASDKYNDSIKHLRVFANNGHLDATVRLAESYRDNSLLYETTLHNAAIKHSVTAQQRLVAHYIETEQWQQLISVPWQLDLTIKNQAHMALQLPLDKVKQSITLYNQTNCADKVLLAAIDLTSFNAATTLKHNFDKQYSLPICLSEPVYFDQTQIKCSNFPAARLSCHITDNRALEQYSFDKLVIVGEKGIANASGNSVRIHAGQSEKVLLHELMHLYGFIDEYPLRKTLADKLCNVEAITQIGKNILVVPGTQNRQNQISYQGQLWFKTHTCDYADGVAYKPTLETTNLELLDLAVPQLYLSILKQTLY